MECGRCASLAEELDADTLYNETVMTALRTREGIALQELSPHYRDYCLRQARRYLNGGWLMLDDGSQRLRLTREGLFVSDRIMADLFVPE